MSDDISSKLTTQNLNLENNGEITLITREGATIGKFDINTVDGFQELAKTIQCISSDPVVRIRASRWL